MKTRYILHIGSTDYELQDDDVRNWDEIRCSYKRSSYDGVVRSFTSKFEFVNRAYEILLEVYLRDRFNASVILEVQTMTDRWGFEKVFECPLDFSSIEWENNTLRINAVDNNLAALIKANKSTKYELLVGSQVPIDKSLKITRIPMQESLTYGFTQGDSDEDTGEITVVFKKDEHPWIGKIGDGEIVINQTVDFQDDQDTEPDSYIMKIINDVKMRFTVNLSYRSKKTYGSVGFTLRVKRDGAVVAYANAGTASQNTQHDFGSWESESQLPDLSIPVVEDKTDLRYNGYATVNGIVYEAKYPGDWSRGYWESTHKTYEEYFLTQSHHSTELDLKKGDIIYIENTINDNNRTSATVRFVKSEYFFEWMATGEDAYVSVCKPQKLAKSLLQMIAGNSVNVHVSISEYDPRLAKTYIMAAESIRNIPSAKIYTSFNEFCDWMSAVFGYVYYIGEALPTKYPNRKDFGRIVGTPYTPTGHYSGSVSTNNIKYNRITKKFFYADGGGGYYETWNGWEAYNNPGTGYPRTDTVFFEMQSTPVNKWVFDEYTGSGGHDPIEFDGDYDVIGSDEQSIVFVHRSEILNAKANVRKFDYCKELKYNVDSSIIYASVTAGYDKKDYESVNGRDEFNFNNTYTTGCTVTDKTLSLLSKYRADSYGIEFAIQKRSVDTTDTTSDKDVFFALCTKDSSGQLVIDRSCKIVNCISDAVFNGAFSPMACIIANAGYIGLQADNLQLTFASSTGNSDIEIDGVPMTSNLTLNTPIATAGTIEFTTDEVEMIGDENDLIEVVSDGVLYRGFLKEVDIKYAREEAAKYKLIVKDIEP